MKYLRRGLMALLVMTLITTGMVYAQDDSQYSVGILLSNEPAIQPAYEGFIEGMAEQGYVEGETITYHRIDALAQNMDETAIAEAGATIAAIDVDLWLVASDRDALLISEMIGGAIPIVVCFSEDMVGSGLADSLTEPGGNVTGIQNAKYHARGLQLLLELDPTIQRVFFPYVLESNLSLTVLDSLQEMSGTLGIELVSVGVLDTEEALSAVQEMPDAIDAIYLPSDGALLQPQVMISLIQASFRLKAGLAIPAAVQVPGVLMGYGPDTFVNGQQAANIADRIIRGADPATLPVENGEYVLMVNLQTAEAIDLEIPRSILRQAGIIIRAGDLDDYQPPHSVADISVEEDN